MISVAFFSFRTYEKVFFNDLNAKEFSVQFFSETLTSHNYALAKGSDVVCCFVNDCLNAAVLKDLAASGLKAIVLRCAGFNNIDLQTAKSLNIRVLRVPAYSPFAVAEHAVALMLTLNRKTHKAYNRVREGNFSIEGLMGFDIHGATVGVVGTGKIGEAFCRIMLGFGAQVLAFDLNKNKHLEETGVKFVDFDEVLERSDILSLHLPLNDKTHHLVQDATIRKMKSGVMLINTSRGGLIDTKAAIRGLKSGKIGSLGIDVYEEEEGLFFYDHSEEVILDDVLLRLMSFPNVLITSHQGFLTKQALENIAQTTRHNLAHFAQGFLAENVVV